MLPVCWGLPAPAALQRLKTIMNVKLCAPVHPCTCALCALLALLAPFALFALHTGVPLCRFIILTEASGKFIANRIGVIDSDTAQHLHHTCTLSTKSQVPGKACKITFVNILSFIIILYLISLCGSQ